VSPIRAHLAAVVSAAVPRPRAAHEHIPPPAGYIEPATRRVHGEWLIAVAITGGCWTVVVTVAINMVGGSRARSAGARRGRTGELDATAALQTADSRPTFSETPIPRWRPQGDQHRPAANSRGWRRAMTSPSRVDRPVQPNCLTAVSLTYASASADSRLPAFERVKKRIRAV